MHVNIKRALALSALAPLAYAGIMSPAGAVSIRTTEASVYKYGNEVYADCIFDNAYYGVKITLAGDGLGNDTTGFDDISSIRVEAEDRNADGDFPDLGDIGDNYEEAMDVKEIRTSYYNFPSSASYALTTAQTGALVADGDAAFAGRNNTRKLNLQVKWTNVGEPGYQSSVTGHCGIVLPQVDTEFLP